MKMRQNTLASYVNMSDSWIIDSGCSNHMTGDKSKFNSLVYYDGNNVRFGNDAPVGNIRGVTKRGEVN